MDTRVLLRDHQAAAEFDAGVWVDDHPLLRRVAGFLAHHRILRTLVLAVAAPLLAVPAAWWSARADGRVVDRAHEIAGEDTLPCAACLTAEADRFARQSALTYADIIDAFDLADGGLS